MASSARKGSERRRSPWIKRIKIAFVLAVFFLCIGVIGLFGLFMVKYQEAESRMVDLGDKMAEVSRPASRILTADGKVLFQVAEVNRIPLHLSQIPKHVQNAVLAAEDKRFYDHAGVDAVGLSRAFLSIFKEGRVSQGGSTITMQLAKNLYSGKERSFMRKVQDIAFATAMEKEIVNKNRILELYLNQVYFGEGAHGIGAAAKVYFNKTVDQLTISDAAMLARCVRLPSRQNPINDLQTAMANRDVVLGIMRDEKMITEQEYADALAETPKVNAHPPKTSASYPAGYGRHFVEHVRKFLDASNLGIDLKRGGYTVYTTLSSDLQKIAERSTARVVAENRGQRVNQGAFLAMDKDGRILCEVGGTSFGRSQYNIVTQGQLQPGSAFKAIVYSTALKDGLLHSADDSISNVPIYDPPKDGQPAWSPQNSGRWETASSYSLRTAFASSVNRCAIHVSRDVGERRVADVAKSVFGFRSPIKPVRSIALGVNEVTPLEMAEAYSVIMLGGDRVRPIPVTRVVDDNGETIKTFEPERWVGVLDPHSCQVMDEVMHATVTSGTGNRVLGSVLPDARGKTGTTNDARDAWFCGYVDGVIGIGWVGNEQIVKGQPRRFPMASSVYGGTVTTYIWRDVMLEARKLFGTRIVLPTSEPVAVPEEEKKPEEVVPEDPAIDPDDPDGTKTDEGATPAKPDEVIPPATDPSVVLPGDPLNTNGDPTKGVPPDEGFPTDKRSEEERKRLRDLEHERRRQQDAEKKAEGDTVTVEICVDSGKLATMYCPETVARQFPRGKAPTQRCRIHGTDD